MEKIKPDINEIKKFWDENPLSSSAIPFEIGTMEYFRYYDKLREKNESIEFSNKLHEYGLYGGRKVLDVGCGNGYVLSNYSQNEAIAYGVDVSSTSVELSKRRFEYFGLEGCFVQSNAEELPFDNNTFDCVCSMGVLHHVPDPEKAVKEIYRVLKKNGKFISMFYHKNSFLYKVTFPLLSKVTKKSIQQYVNEVDGMGNPKGDVYSRTELSTLLKDFVNIELNANLFQNWMFLPRGMRFIPDSLIKPLGRHVGWFLYATCIKM